MVKSFLPCLAGCNCTIVLPFNQYEHKCLYILMACIWRHQKHDCDKFAPNFDMVYNTTQRVFVADLKSITLTKTELWAKAVGEFPIMLYELGWWAFFCPPTWLYIQLCGDFSNVEQHQLLHLVVYRHKTCRDISKRNYQHCIKN